MTYPDDNEECVDVEKNKNIDDEKETICPEVTHPEDVQEYVGDKNMTITTELMMKQR